MTGAMYYFSGHHILAWLKGLWHREEWKNRLVGLIVLLWCLQYRVVVRSMLVVNSENAINPELAKERDLTTWHIVDLVTGTMGVRSVSSCTPCHPISLSHTISALAFGMLGSTGSIAELNSNGYNWTMVDEAPRTLIQYENCGGKEANTHVNITFNCISLLGTEILNIGEHEDCRFGFSGLVWSLGMERR